MNSHALASLYRRWWIVTIAFGLALGVGLLTQSTGRLVITAMVMTYELWLLRRNLKYNRRQNEHELLPTLGAGNILTLFRGLILAWLAGFLLSPWPTFIPFFLYLLAALTDGFDGFVARRTNHATRMGEILDIEFDALGILVATGLAINYGQLPWLFLILGLARYLFVFGIWWRKQYGKPVYDLPFSVTRRLLAGFQMGFIAVMLWPGVYPPGTTLAGVVFAVPFLAIFTRDWLIVSGHINPASSTYITNRRKLVIILTYWLPVLLRIVVAISTMSLIITAVLPIPDSAKLTDADPILTIIVGLACISMLLVVFGVAGRLVMLGLISLAALFILGNGLDFTNGLMLSSTIAIMLLGTGAFSLWKPEDRFLNRRAKEN
jgi:CDP-diacylglycerol--glycerol-3-phosphate 3-phosphatidyltransferase